VKWLLIDTNFALRVLYEVITYRTKLVYLADVQDLRVYTIWRAEISHFKTQHMSYRKTGTEVCPIYHSSNNK
jgi:hypothetical protein